MQKKGVRERHKERERALDIQKRDIYTYIKSKKVRGTKNEKE